LHERDSLNAAQIQGVSEKPVIAYKDDFDWSLGNKFIQFAEFSKLLFKPEDISYEQFLSKLRIDKSLHDSFVSAETALRSLLVFMISNCCGEREMSKLKFVQKQTACNKTHGRLPEPDINEH